jgi:hypothetical protein
VTAGSWFSKKNRLIKIWSDKLQTLNPQDNEVKTSNKYEEVLGITKCLRIGSRNFIIHFKTRADEEWLSEKRDDIIKAIVERFRKDVGRGCHIFGVSSPGLGDFLTTEKDLLRKICKMPNQEFLISDTKILDIN